MMNILLSTVHSQFFRYANNNNNSDKRPASSDTRKNFNSRPLARPPRVNNLKQLFERITAAWLGQAARWVGDINYLDNATAKGMVMVKFDQRIITVADMNRNTFWRLSIFRSAIL